ncbi:MAG: hypothetical protein JWO38_3025 [Gemmataceae bacterium]|nr:hypothetical protein [Gemmataceae bacterium]
MIPASVVTVTASLTSGPGMDVRAAARARNPGRVATTAPNPYSEAVFRAASRAPATADLEPAANRLVTGLQARTSVLRIPTSRAPSTAQMAATFETSCTPGEAAPAAAGVKETDGPYTPGMAAVNSLFKTPTRMSGRTATRGWDNVPRSKGSGSLTGLAP